jgi:hypothetical protein
MRTRAAAVGRQRLTARAEGWCEMAASLRGREPGSRGTVTDDDTAD